MKKKTKKATLTTVILSASALALVISYNNCSSGGGGGGGGGSGGSGGSAVTAWAGTKQLGASGTFAEANSVTTDSQGNVIEAGYTTGGLDGNTITGIQDCFVAKYNADGVPQWARQVGAAAATTQCQGVAVDSTGNIYVTGYTNGALDGNTQTGLIDFFFSKYDASGNKQWTHQLGGAGTNTYAYAISLDNTGDILIGGTTGGGINSNPNEGITDAFAIKYDSTGTLQWFRHRGVAGGNVAAYAVAADSSGGATVVGQTDKAISGSLNGTLDGLIIHYAANGNFAWFSEFGAAAAATHGTGVTADSSGNVIMTGYTNGSLYGNPYVSGTGADTFVTKLVLTNGSLTWANQFGVAGADTKGSAVTADAAGNVLVTGYTTGNLANPVAGTNDLFVTHFNASGPKQWITQFGVSGGTVGGLGISTDASGSIFVVGTTNRGLDNDAQAGTSDAFVTKFNSGGVKQ